MQNITFKGDSTDFSHVNDDYSGVRKMESGCREQVEFLTGSSIRIWYNDQPVDFDAHCHDALEIIMPVENYYDVKTDSASFRVMPGEVIILPPGTLHSLSAPPDGGIRFIYMFDVDTLFSLKGFAGLQPLLAQPLYITQNAYPDVYSDICQSLTQMHTEYFCKNEFYELTIYSLLINLFVRLARNRINTRELFPNVRIYKQKEYIQKFNDLLDYIDRHYSETLNLENVAASIGFSKYHFSRLFKQYTGYTFCDYLCHRRIKAAEELLVQPNLSITEVALQSGFSSISTFNRLFKQEKQCTPSEFRAKNNSVWMQAKTEI